MQVTNSDLENIYEEMTRFIRVECELTRPIVGGQPAAEKDIAAFVRHHLGLEGEDAEKAVRRILKDEVGERDVRPEDGELDEQEVYGVNVIRRDEHGPWVGDWMVKACLKVAASRLGLFVAKKGSKGDLAEFGAVYAFGNSLKGGPHKIHLYDGAGQPVKTGYEDFRGRVNTPQGAKSIVHTSEVAPEGSRMSFELRVPPGKITQKDLLAIFAFARKVGLGSARSLERGRWKILAMEIQDLPEVDGKKEKPAKEKEVANA